MKSNNIEIFADLEEISRRAAEEFISEGKKAITKSDRFTVALSGGSTPRNLYQLLATEEFSGELDWEKVYFFFGDERDVSPASVKSNYKMVRELFFKPLKIKTRNIFRWRTEIINPVEVAEQYERIIRRFFELGTGEYPRFDLVFLGMGDDGHTASLFPHTQALAENERIAVANWVEKFDSHRLTLTYPVLNNAVKAVFLVSGANKAETLQQIFEGDSQPEKFPARNVKLKSGKLVWLIDEKAAGLLKRSKAKSNTRPGR